MSTMAKLTSSASSFDESILAGLVHSNEVHPVSNLYRDNSGNPREDEHLKRNAASILPNIRAHGFNVGFPLIGVIKGNATKVRVIDGNSRLTALQTLAGQDAKWKDTLIPVVVYRDITEEQIAALRIRAQTQPAMSLYTKVERFNALIGVVNALGKLDIGPAALLKSGRWPLAISQDPKEFEKECDSLTPDLNLAKLVIRLGGANADHVLINEIYNVFRFVGKEVKAAEVGTLRQGGLSRNIVKGLLKVVDDTFAERARLIGLLSLNSVPLTPETKKVWDSAITDSPVPEFQTLADKFKPIDPDGQDGQDSQDSQDKPQPLTMSIDQLTWQSFANSWTSASMRAVWSCLKPSEIGGPDCQALITLDNNLNQLERMLAESQAQTEQPKPKRVK